MDYGELKQTCKLSTLDEDSKEYTANKLANAFGDIINGQDVVSSRFVNGISLPSVVARPDYLRFTAEEDSSLFIRHSSISGTAWTASSTVQYSTDGVNFSDYGPITNHSGQVISLQSGDTVYFRSKNHRRYATLNASTTTTGNNLVFQMAGKLRGDGNMMTFLDCDGLCTTIGNYTFAYIFSGCTALTKAPELPATSIGAYAYFGMFYRCTGLKEGPSILPAKYVPEYAYSSMFLGCTYLEKGPFINMSFLRPTNYGLRYMFSGCTRLKLLGMMVLNAPGTAYTNNWLAGTNNTTVSGRTIYLASGTTWNPGTTNSGIPGNWTKIYV